MISFLFLFDKTKFNFLLFWIGLILFYLVWISLFSEVQFIIIPLSFLLIYFIFIKPDYYLPFILLMYLVVVGEINPTLRVVVHLIGFISLSVFLFNNKDKIKSIYETIDKRIKKYLLYFFSIIFISSIFSQLPLKGLEILFKELYFFFIVFSFYVYLKIKGNVSTIIIVVMTAGIVMSLSSILNLKNFSLTDIIFTGSSAFRTGGLLSNVNALSGYIVVVFPFFLCFYILTKSLWLRGVLLLGMILLSLGVLATISRSAGLSIIIGLLFFSYFVNKKVTWTLVLSILIITILSNLLPNTQIIFSALRLEQGFSQRDLLWQLSIDMFKDNWFLGVGPGLWGEKMFNYSPVLQDSFVGYLFYDVNKITEGFNNSHNYYLVFMSDMGIPGLFLALYLPFVFFSLAKENLKISKTVNREFYLLNIAITTIGVSMFIRAFFEGISIITFGWVAIDLPFWIVFTLLSLINNNLKNQIKSTV
uniref:O-antigen ligase domain-containing protein n=1 Tax=Ignavibacterium album TaxID=591197 RepID=A0A832G7N5_9BACT